MTREDVISEDECLPFARLLRAGLVQAQVILTRPMVGELIGWSVATHPSLLSTQERRELSFALEPCIV